MRDTDTYVVTVQPVHIKYVKLVQARFSALYMDWLNCYLMYDRIQMRRCILWQIVLLF